MSSRKVKFGVKDGFIRKIKTKKEPFEQKRVKTDYEICWQNEINMMTMQVFGKVQSYFTDYVDIKPKNEFSGFTKHQILKIITAYIKFLTDMIQEDDKSTEDFIDKIFK